MKDELNFRQERFCQEYTSDPKRNQTRAAIRAGYSEKTARTIAYENMRKPDILRRIAELEREALEEAGYSPESLRSFLIRRRLTRLGVRASDIVSVIYPDDERRKAALEQLADANGGQTLIDFGNPLVYVKPTSEWTPDEREAVKAIRQTKEGIEIVLYDQQTDEKALAEIAGIVKSGVDVSLSISDGIEEARQRINAGGEGTE